MMLRIHPAIGMARVGNSPTEYFFGPEIPGVPPDPTGGFKDSQCRVKRQAARFRVFAYLDDGAEAPIEVTAAIADIRWTVTVANFKNGNTVSAEPVSIRGTSQPPMQITGTGLATSDYVSMYLGELQTDESGRLIALGEGGAARNTTAPGWPTTVSASRIW
jgi:hypothetical protein